MKTANTQKNPPRAIRLNSQSLWFLSTANGDLLFLGNPNTGLEYHLSSFNELIGNGSPSRHGVPVFAYQKNDPIFLRTMREWNRQTKPKRKDADHTAKVFPFKGQMFLCDVETTRAMFKMGAR